MSKASLHDDDKLEVLEFYIGMLQEKVENFQKEKSPPRSTLNDFMTEYIDLEDKILKIMENLNHVPEISQEQMETLTTTFSKYWTDFQDEWSDENWEVYNMYRQIKDKDINYHVNKISYTGNNSFAEESKDNKGIDFDNFNGINRNSPISQGQMKDKRGLSTHDDSFNMTTVNLNKIDEEMKEVQEMSIVREKKEEKKRSCLDCIIF